MSKFPNLQQILIDKIYGNPGCWRDFNNQYRAWERIQYFIDNQKPGMEIISKENFDTPPDYTEYPQLGCEKSS